MPSPVAHACPDVAGQVLPVSSTREEGIAAVWDTMQAYVSAGRLFGERMCSELSQWLACGLTRFAPFPN